MIIYVTLENKLPKAVVRVLTKHLCKTMKV